jgi:hypothetical protein
MKRLWAILRRSLRSGTVMDFGRESFRRFVEELQDGRATIAIARDANDGDLEKVPETAKERQRCQEPLLTVPDIFYSLFVLPVRSREPTPVPGTEPLPPSASPIIAAASAEQQHQHDDQNDSVHDLFLCLINHAGFGRPDAPATPSRSRTSTSFSLAVFSRFP